MAAASAKFNLRNPAVKRIMQEMKEIQQDTSGDFLAEALETDIFEWHFVIRGTPDTEFEGGIYHGRILLPADYPFKPPSFMLLTPNGRFETNMKICLTISNHHPEAWQPSWSVRTALVALIAFMPSPAIGALGALEYPKEERRALAARSRLEAPRFGNVERQAVIDDMHRRMLAMAAGKGAQPQHSPDVAEQSPNHEASEDHTPAQASDRQGSSEDEGPTAPPASAGDEAVPDTVMATRATAVDGSGADELTASEKVETAVGTSLANGDVAKDSSHSSGIAEDARLAVTSTVANDPHLHKHPCLEPQSGVDRSQVTTSTGVPGAASNAWPRVHAAATAATPAALGVTERQTDAAYTAATALNSTDHALTAAMLGLSLAIAFMVIRKVLSVVGYDFSELMQLLQMLP